MPKVYMSFQEIRDRVMNAENAYAVVGENNLNESGRVDREAIIDIAGCFRNADTESEVIEHIHNSICGWEHVSGLEVTCGFTDGKEAANVAERMKQFVRNNFKPELWENIPEFKTAT